MFKGTKERGGGRGCSGDRTQETGLRYSSARNNALVMSVFQFTFIIYLHIFMYLLIFVSFGGTINN